MNKKNNFEEILAVLPQTQCGQCGFSSCKPYAEAIAEKKATINLCPPGGLQTLSRLAEITQQKITETLKSELEMRLESPHVAIIHEESCIGCMKCLNACPVDAIFGAAKLMHVVLSEDCTGCKLCIDPCPMDCIEMIPVKVLTYKPIEAKAAYERKIARGSLHRAGFKAEHGRPNQSEKSPIKASLPQNRKQLIQEAVARAKAKKHLS